MSFVVLGEGGVCILEGIAQRRRTRRQYTHCSSVLYLSVSVYGGMSGLWVRAHFSNNSSISVLPILALFIFQLLPHAFTTCNWEIRIFLEVLRSPYAVSWIMNHFPLLSGILHQDAYIVYTRSFHQSMQVCNQYLDLVGKKNTTF